MYERLGFKEVGLISQHQGVVEEIPLCVHLPTGVQLGAASKADLARLVELDHRAFGAPRKALIEQLMNKGEVVVLKHNDQVTGFAVSRAFGRGRVIGPVVASDLELAKALISHGLVQAQQSPNTFVRVDVHEKSGLEPWLSDLNLKSAGGAVAMVKGTVPKRDPMMKSWALVSQSLG